MRSVILLLLAVSVASAINCYAGGTVNGRGLFTKGPCLAGEQYCYTSDVTIQDVRMITKTCGMDVCKAEGCTPTDGGKICCCKGNLCNA